MCGAKLDSSLLKLAHLHDSHVKSIAICCDESKSHSVESEVFVPLPMISVQNVNGTSDVAHVQTPVGRLRNAVSFWDEAGVDRYIPDVINNRYKLPMKVMLDSAFLKNNKSVGENPDFVYSEITKLESLGCISNVSEKPFVVNSRKVAFNKVIKPRLVLVCRHINPCLFTFKYK